MKKTAILLAMATLLISCGDNGKVPTSVINIEASADSNEAQKARENGAAAITFETSSHDFGLITEGEIAEYNFRFKNTGTGDLIISAATASCGCTVPEFSREPIAPGKEGFIKVKFNSEHRVDQFNKQISVTANTMPTTTELTISGVVKARPSLDENPNNFSH